MCWCGFLFVCICIIGTCQPYRQDGTEYQMWSDPNTPALFLVDKKGDVVKDLETASFTHCLYFFLISTANHDYHSLVSYASRSASIMDEVSLFVKPSASETNIYVHNVLASLKHEGDGPKTDTWKHVCYSWSARTLELKLYYDGSRLTSVANFSRPVNIGENGVLVLGQDQDAYGGKFQPVDGLRGAISHFNAWNKVLSDSEVKAVYEGKLFGNKVDERRAFWKAVGGVVVLPHQPPVAK